MIVDCPNAVCGEQRGVGNSGRACVRARVMRANVHNCDNYVAA